MELTMEQINSENEIQKKKSIVFNPITSSVFIIATICILSFYYFIISNSLTASGFLINENKEKLNSLQKQNQDLELEVMNMESYYDVSERLESLKMVKVDQVDYIEVIEEVVARK